MINFKKRRIFIYDLNRLFMILYIFIPVMLLAFFTAGVIFKDSVFILDAQGIKIKPSFFDLLLELYKGKEVFIINSKKSFEPPAYWLATQLYTLLIANFPLFQITKFEKHILILSKKRSTWWISKCFKMICFVFASYVSQYFCIFLVSLKGRPFCNSSTVFVEKYSQLPFLTNTDILLYAIVLPVLVSCVLALMQLVLSFIIGNVGAFIAIAVYIMLSTYIYSPLFIPNASMLLRSNLCYNKGFNFIFSVIQIIILFIVLTIAGGFIFKKYDVLEHK